MEKSQAFRMLASRLMHSASEPVLPAFLLLHPFLQERCDCDESCSLLSLWTAHFVKLCRPKEGPPRDLTSQQRTEAAIETMLNFMSVWSSTYPMDFSHEQRKKLLATICNYCKDHPLVNEVKLRFLKSSSSSGEKSRSQPKKSRRRTTTYSSPSFMLGFQLSLSKPEAIAKALTAKEVVYFRCIKDRECTFQAWQAQSRKTLATNLCNAIERFNQVSYWVVTQVLLRETPEERAQFIVLTIKVAKICFELSNLNTLMQILCGLSNSSVRRLRETWSLVPEKHQEALAAFDAFMAARNNFKRYREGFEAKPHPKLPYLGLILRDLTYIEDGNKMFNEDGSLNESRMLMLYQQIAALRELQQQCNYRFAGTSPRSSKTNSHTHTSDDGSAADPQMSPPLASTNNTTATTNNGVTDDEMLLEYIDNLCYIDDEEKLYELSLKHSPTQLSPSSCPSPSLSSSSSSSEDNEEAPYIEEVARDKEQANSLRTIPCKEEPAMSKHLTHKLKEVVISATRNRANSDFDLDYGGFSSAIDSLSLQVPRNMCNKNKKKKKRSKTKKSYNSEGSDRESTVDSSLGSPTQLSPRTSFLRSTRDPRGKDETPHKKSSPLVKKYHSVETHKHRTKESSTKKPSKMSGSNGSILDSIAEIPENSTPSAEVDRAPVSFTYLQRRSRRTPSADSNPTKDSVTLSSSFSAGSSSTTLSSSSPSFCLRSPSSSSSSSASSSLSSSSPSTLLRAQKNQKEGEEEEQEEEMAKESPRECRNVAFLLSQTQHVRALSLEKEQPSFEDMF
ncbi:RasGEF domain containing protein [Balamuthia mandrillaris]